MAQVKFTRSDIFARLAKGECANFVGGCCLGSTPCTVINGESCEYFDKYVKPLLDFPEFHSKYSREAKVTVALNPKSKVVRKRRMAAEPSLSIDVPAAKTAAAKAVHRTDAKQSAAKDTRSGANQPTAPIAKRTPTAESITLTAPTPSRADTRQQQAKRGRHDTSSTGDAVRRDTPNPRVPEAAITTTVGLDGAVRTRPRATPGKKASQPATPDSTRGDEQQQLFLEITPAAPVKHKTSRKR